MLLGLLSVVLAASPGCASAVLPDNPTTVSGVAIDSLPAAPQPAEPRPAHPIDSTRTDSVRVDSVSVPVPGSDSGAAPGGPIVVKPDTVSPAPPPHLVRLDVTPASATVEAGSNRSLQVRGTLSDGSPAPSVLVTWAAQRGTITPDGVFTAGATAGAGSATATSGTVSATVPLLVVAAPDPLPLVVARSADAFVNSIGVNVHLGYWDTPYGGGYESIIKPRLLQLGVHHVRDVGTVVADDAWMQSVYGRMRDLADRGIKFDLVMQPAAGSSDYSSLGHWNRLIGFVGYAVEGFEGLNEHDLSGRSNWVAEVRSFQAALAAQVRGDSRTSSLPLYGPSIGHPVNASAVGALASFLDYGNLHAYPGGRVPLASLAMHEQYLSGIGPGRSWIVTETGYHNAVTAVTDHPAVSEAAAARYVPRLLLDNFRLGISRSYLYELIDEGTNAAEQEQNFGLVRHDGSPKPAFTAVQNLITILADPGPAFTPASLGLRLGGDTTGVTMLVLGKRDGRQYLVMWQDVASYDAGSRSTIDVTPRPVTLQVAGNAQLKVFDPARSASALSVQRAGTLTIAVGDSPVVVEIGQ